MIQLIVEGSNGEVFLDLYENDPIKLTFNIEDVLDVAVQSEYARQFRVPATPKNSQFFESAFEINGLDFDVTTIKPARIAIGGSDFRRGEIRLQKIYKNELNGKFDYEVIFLGATKSLGTSIGTQTINDLDLSAYEHDLNYTNVTTSWGAYPQGGLTDGLFNGDIVYPLVDFGNRYGEVGGGFSVLETRIAVGSGIHFTQPAYPVNPLRFRPMMRVKTLIDKIFEEAGFTYESVFFNSNEAQQMYLSSWGDDAIVSVNGQSTNLAKAQIQGDVGLGVLSSGNTFFGYYNQSAYDWGNNFNYEPFTNQSPAEDQVISYYQHNEAGQYSFRHSLDVQFSWPQLSPGVGFQYETLGFLGSVGGTSTPSYGLRFTGGLNVDGEPYVQVEMDTGAGYASIASGTGWSYVGNNVVPVSIFYEDSISSANPGDNVIIFAYLNIMNSPAFGLGSITQVAAGITNGYFEVFEAPGAFTINTGFNSTYKQIDFLKDIFKMFRMVLVPDPDNPTNFKIEPWQFYIGTGEVKDWTRKMDLSKDIVIEPLVNEQTDKVRLAMAEDEDWLNKLNQNQFKETFGTAIIDSPYDILEGEREIKVGIAPTPATQIQGYFGDSPNWNNIIIPQICTQEVDNDIVVYKPIKAKPRILYYNGLESSGTWYFEDIGGPTYTQDSVPIASYYSQWLPQPNAKILNFQKENGYDQEDVVNNNYGQDLYSRYWSQYINTIYDRWSRRLTAYFVLDDYDLVNFEYSDVIFIKDTYFYVEKIYDAPLGQRDKVKVDLIKLPNYTPNTAGFIPVGEYWEDISDNWEAISTLWEQL